MRFIALKKLQVVVVQYRFEVVNSYKISDRHLIL